jgi:hypothetical protein
VFISVLAEAGLLPLIRSWIFLALKHPLSKRSVTLASKLKSTRIIRLPQMTSASSLLLKRLLSAITR